MKKRSIGIALSTLYTFLNMIIGLFISSFLLNRIGDTEYGLYQTVSSFATYLVLLEFGTGSVMSRNVVVARNKNDDQYLKQSVSTVWYMTVFLSIVISIVSLAFYFNIGNIYAKTMNTDQVEYAKKIFIWIVGYLICSFIVQTLNGLLLGLENYKFGQIFNIVRLLLRTVLLVAVISFIQAAVYIAIIDFSVSLLILVFSYLYCKKEYKIKFSYSYFSFNVFKKSIPLCSALLIQSLVNQANNSVDKFLIGVQMSLEAVAIYSIAQYIYSIFSAVTTIPISMYLPQIAKDIGDSYDGKKITKTLLAPSRLICFFGGTIIFGFICCGKQFISIMYGENKIEAWVYALIIMIPMLFNMITGPIVNVLDVLDKRQSRSYALVVTTVLNIIMTVFFINIWGIIGAVIATAIATVLGQIVIMNIYYVKILHIDIKWLYLRSMINIVPFQMIASLICYFIGFFINNKYISFFTSGGSYIIISTVLLLLFGLSKEEMSALKKKMKSIGNRLRIKNGK